VSATIQDSEIVEAGAVGQESCNLDKGSKGSTTNEVAVSEGSGGALVILQVNCRSIYNKVLEFWNLVDAVNPDVIIGTESWLKEDIEDAEVFRADYTTYRRDRSIRGGGVFICIKRSINSARLWVDDEFEILAVEVIGKKQDNKWEIIGIYRPPNDDMGAIDN